LRGLHFQSVESIVYTANGVLYVRDIVVVTHRLTRKRRGRLDLVPNRDQGAAAGFGVFGNDALCRTERIGGNFAGGHFVIRFAVARSGSREGCSKIR
jgi:hypothetical protein